MKDFPDLFAEFLEAKSFRIRPKTIRGYTDVNFRYWRWVSEQTNPPEWTHVTSIERYLSSRRRDGLAEVSIATTRRTLSVFFNWLIKRGYLDINPVSLTDPPRLPRKLKDYVTHSDFKQLMATIPTNTWTDLRDRCLILILFYSGLRAGEVVRLRPHDIDKEYLFITVIDGKGGNDRVVPCSPSVPAAMAAYVEARPPWSGSQLFVSNNGGGGIRGPITADGVRQMLGRRFKAAQAAYHNTKSFRHAFGMNFLNAGVRISSLAKMMGHTDTKVTAIYAQHQPWALSEEYREAYEKLK